MNEELILEKIRKLRVLKDIKQFDIAKQLGISESAYGNLERGETELTLSKLKKIAEILRVPALSFLDGTANYVIENGNESPLALHNSSVVTSDKELVEQLLASKNKEVFAKDEIIATLKEYIYII
jgi:transcriptional regulator with XRE-family HTH domain